MSAKSTLNTIKVNLRAVLGKNKYWKIKTYIRNNVWCDRWTTKLDTRLAYLKYTSHWKDELFRLHIIVTNYIIM